MLTLRVHLEGAVPENGGLKFIGVTSASFCQAGAPALLVKLKKPTLTLALAFLFEY